MPSLLSGSTLRTGGSGEFINLADAMPQLPPNADTSTGYTIVTNALKQTSYRNSLGNLEMYKGEIWSNLPEGTIRLTGTNTGVVLVTRDTVSTSTDSGALVVTGGIGVGGTIWVNEDIHVNDLLIGQGWEGTNNVVIQGKAVDHPDEYNFGRASIAIGHDALLGLETSYKNIAIGRYALSSGTDVSNSIAIGDSALKLSGVTSKLPASNILDLQISQEAVITQVSNDSQAIVSSTAHGFSTGTRVYIEGIVGLNTGTFNILNEKSFYVSKINDDTFYLYYDSSLTNIVDASAGVCTPYAYGGVAFTPISITVDQHSFSSGTRIYIDNITDPVDVNSQTYYVNVVSESTLTLYKNLNISIAATSTNLTPYSGGGIVYRYLIKNNNIAIGTNAGSNFIDGERNFFFGDGIARNFTTGSNNFLVGHEVGYNLTHGNAIIAIGGDNIVDGVDNQVNIGSVFYYNGSGYLQLNADVGLGIGSNSTGTGSGALTVLGGVGISEDVYIGGTTRLIADIETNSINSGTLIVTGGVGIGRELYVGGALNAEGAGRVTLSPHGYDVYIQPAENGSVFIRPNVLGNLDNVNIGYLAPADGIFLNLTVTNVAVGTITTANNLSNGKLGSIPYQTAPGSTSFIDIGSTDTVLVSNGTTATWVSINNLSPDTSTGALTVFVDPVSTNTRYYLGLSTTVSNYTTVTSDISLVYNTTEKVLSTTKLQATSTETSTTTVAGQAIEVLGGIGIAKDAYVSGSVYSQDGQAAHGYLLYTPKVTVSSTPPADPKIGDFWINSTSGRELQYIKDGTSTFWIQFAGL